MKRVFVMLYDSDGSKSDDENYLMGVINPDSIEVDDYEIRDDGDGRDVRDHYFGELLTVFNK